MRKASSSRSGGAQDIRAFGLPVATWRFADNCSRMLALQIKAIEEDIVRHGDLFKARLDDIMFDPDEHVLYFKERKGITL